ncbi:hypothetical protein D9M72_647750 [compost metagenome]
MHAIGDAVGDGARLSGAGTREHAEGSVQRARNLPLLVVQTAENALFQGPGVQQGGIGGRAVAGQGAFKIVSCHLVLMSIGARWISSVSRRSAVRGEVIRRPGGPG